MDRAEGARRRRDRPAKPEPAWRRADLTAGLDGREALDRSWLAGRCHHPRSFSFSRAQFSSVAPTSNNGLPITAINQPHSSAVLRPSQAAARPIAFQTLAPGGDFGSLTVQLLLSD